MGCCLLEHRLLCIIEFNANGGHYLDRQGVATAGGPRDMIDPIPMSFLVFSLYYFCNSLSPGVVIITLSCLNQLLEMLLLEDRGTFPVRGSNQI